MTLNVDNVEAQLKGSLKWQFVMHKLRIGTPWGEWTNDTHTQTMPGNASFLQATPFLTLHLEVRFLPLSRSPKPQPHWAHHRHIFPVHTFSLKGIVEEPKEGLISCYLKQPGVYLVTIWSWGLCCLNSTRLEKKRSFKMNGPVKTKL